MFVNFLEVFIWIFVVFMVGIFLWIISMVGYFFNLYGFEIKIFKKFYLVLVEFSEVIGGENINDVWNCIVNVLREVEEIFLIGYILWKNLFLFNCLLFLNEEVNKLFLEMFELYVNKNIKVLKEFSNMIRKLFMVIELKDGEIIKIDILF